MEELGPGGSCGVHSWIEGVSDDGRRVSWFAPQNQGGGRRLKTPSRGGTGVGLGTGGGTGVDGVYGLAAGEEVTGIKRHLGPSEGRGGNNVQGHGVEAEIFPRVEFWRFSQNRPPTRVSWTLQNREPDLHQHGGIAEKTLFRRKNLNRHMRSCTGGCCRPTGLTGPWNRFDRSRRV